MAAASPANPLDALPVRLSNLHRPVGSSQTILVVAAPDRVGGARSTRRVSESGPPRAGGLCSRFRLNVRGVHQDMSKLTERARAKLPARMFGLPEKARTPEAKTETGNYPIPDRGHAISAKRLSRKQRKAGNLTNDEFDRINRKADKMLRQKPKS